MYDSYITMDSSGFLEVKSLVHSYQYMLDINIVTTVYAVICTANACTYIRMYKMLLVDSRIHICTALHT